MISNVLVVGFFDRKNLGDESYKITMKRLFGSEIEFKCIDDINITSLLKNINSFAAIVWGGGDIMNNYFLKYLKIVRETFKGPIYAVSVGIPYQYEFVMSKQYELFDHMFLRTKTDYDFLKEYVGKENIDFVPDIAWLLDMEPNTIEEKQNHVGICLAQPMFYKNENKENLINSMVAVCERLINVNKTKISFIPFNTNETNNKESDFIINKTVINRLLPKYSNAWIDEIVETDPNKMLNLFQTLDIVIGMRFHSIVFAARANTPFVALQVTNKMKNTLLDYQCTDNVYEIEKNSNYKPIHLDEEKLYQMIVDNMNKPKNIHVDLLCFKKCGNIMKNKKRKSKILLKSNVDDFSEIEIKVKNNVMTYLRLSNQQIEAIYKGDTTFPKLESYNDLARIILYSITNSLNSPCFWGLCNNMKGENFILKDAVEYIHKFHMMNKNKQINKPNVIDLQPKLLLHLNPGSKEDYSFYHRAGWHYVSNGLSIFDCKQDNNKYMILDDYIDKTFHWGETVLKQNNIIPYTKRWAGIIHHTFHKQNGENSCNNLINNQCFIESLHCCKCLITLSKYLKDQLTIELGKKKISIPIYNLVHPTEFTEKMFTIENFNNNQEKMIIQIGNWLRNPFTFYTLKIPLKKTILNFTNSENNSIPNTFVKDITAKYNNSAYIYGLSEYLKEINESVTFMDKLSNDEYDELLSKNIVFLHLIDASAVNTVLECIVRNTPVIVNKHPAVEELLGSDYPGFYSKLVEIEAVSTYENINKIYNYLVKMDKNKFKLETFIENLQNVLI